MKKLKYFRPLILSRHPSHNVLRASTKNISLLPVKSVVRLGSSTECKDTIENGGDRIEVNTVQSIKHSANKLLMKQKFEEAGVKTAEWFKYDGNNWFIENLNFENKTAITDLPYPIVAKSHFGSKGKGNTLIKSQEELESWMQGKTLSNYIFEKFMNFGHEFRLHVTEDGCFYTCRKALKSDTPDEERWHFHDTTCVWFLETNENFHKPNSWSDIEQDCIKALKAIGADLLSFDVKVQTPYKKDGTKRDYQEYILLECNSASSMDNGSGELSVCSKKYIEEIPKIIIKKYIANNGKK